MAPVKRIVLDLLKPHEPSILDVSSNVAEGKGVDGVNATLLETDKEVENIKLTIEGEDIDFEDVKEKIEKIGCSIHSLDEVICGQHIVEESETKQDRP